MSELIIYSIEYNKKANAMHRGYYRNLKIVAAAEGIFNELDDSLKRKYNTYEISNLIKKADKNKDGIITEDEAKKDTDNIFGLKDSDNTELLDRIQTSVNKKVNIADIKELLNRGLMVKDDFWPTVKTFTLMFTSNEQLKRMFSNKDAVEYYCKEVDLNSNANKHLVDLFRANKITTDDVKAMNFSEEVLNDILRLYEK